MGTSKKDAARSAKRKQPVPKPTPQPEQPKKKRINGKKLLRRIFAADTLVRGRELLNECWREINRVYPMLHGIDAERADKLRRLISVHVREVADVLHLQDEIEAGLEGGAQAEGGAS